MRRSRYTVEARTADGNLLLYNAGNGAFAELDNRASRLWESFAGTDLPAQDADAGDSTAQELARHGFLTELTPAQELARQQSLFDAERADTSTLTLSFIPTYACNFRCPYCYELGHNKIKGTMDGRIIEAVMDFVAFKYDQDNFGRLSVQWYGGDPSLALDAVEELSGKLIAWCEGNDVAFEAMMLTNANVIDAAAADLIARCRVSSAMLTIDGPEQLHNRRRIAANGSNSYERTIQAARLLRARGLHLFATMNTDKVNIAYYQELREKLLAEEGIALGMGKLNDYGHFFGEAPFCAPDFDLFEHEEFFEAQFEEFAKQPHTAFELRDMLRPIRRFCTGQSDNYFIIDLLGDVYKCDGWVGDKGYVRFSLFDDSSSWNLHDVTFDATRDEKCSECELLPVCLGSCHWERVCSGMPCHPFKTTIGGYLRIYRDCCQDAEGLRMADRESGVTLLAQPYSPHELGWEEACPAF